MNSQSSRIKNSIPSVLVIAGFDPSGGAGLLADCKTIHANGGYAATVMSSLTIQNTQGVKSSNPIDANLFNAQLETLAEDIDFDAIKIGMLATQEQVEIVANFLMVKAHIPSVLDPVLVSSSGRPLLEACAHSSFVETLLPNATLLTPNLLEINTLLSLAKPPASFDETTLEANITALQRLRTQNILVKGGHSEKTLAEDFLFADVQSQPTVERFSAPRLSVTHNHGTGCTLASAIAVNLAKGQDLIAAISAAKSYLTQALQTADANQPNYQTLPAGKKRHGSVNHLLNHFLN